MVVTRSTTAAASICKTGLSQDLHCDTSSGTAPGLSQGPVPGLASSADVCMQKKGGVVDSWPCGGCSKEVGETVQSIECTTCQVWWHKRCSGLSTADFREHCADARLTWNCPLCIKPVPMLPVQSSLVPSSSDMPSNSWTAAKSMKNCAIDISIFSFNVNGILQKLPHFLIFLKQADPDVIFVSETNVPNGLVPSLMIDALMEAGYLSVWSGRSNSHGGVAIIYKKDLLQDVTSFSVDSDVENIIIRASMNRAPISFCAAYCPPAHPSANLATVEQFLDELPVKLLSSKFVIGGDMNLDLLDLKVRLATIEVFSSYELDLATTHNKPTRLPPANSSSKRSAIDHIWTNIESNTNGTVEGFSDHHGIFCTVSVRPTLDVSARNNAAPSRQVRNLAGISISDFQLGLQSIPWPAAGQCKDVNTFWLQIKSRLLNILDQFAPAHPCKPSKRRTLADEAKANLAPLVREHRSLVKLCLMQPSPDNSNALKDAKRRLRRASRRFLYGHFRARLEAAKKDPRKVWQVLNASRPAKNPTGATTLPVGMANDFNLAFARVGASIAEETLQPDFSRRSSHHTEPFDFKVISAADVTFAARLLRHRPTTGYDGIPERVLKLAAPIIAEQLAALFNQSIADGEFPEDWQYSIVTPIHKSGDRSMPSNYRPVSVTCCTLKLMERCVSSQLKSYLSTTGFLSPSQFGFRKGHNCESCLIRMTEDWRSDLDVSKSVGVVALDLSKAFDSLHPSGIISSLQSAGVSDRSIGWFRSYLLRRQQLVKMGNTLSEPAAVGHGVPQGSVLGPLLFTLYVNELPTHCRQSRVQQFADDTTIYAAGASSAEIEAKLNDDLTRLTKWLHLNCLKINPLKTQFMLVTNNRSMANSPPSITINGSDIPATTSLTILGVRLDSRLTMKEQVNFVVGKARSGTYALRITNKFADRSGCKMVYEAIVQSYFNYCDGVLGQASKTQLDRLQVAQNKAVRAIVGAKPRSSAAPILKKLGYLNLDGKRRVHMATAVWKGLHGQVPDALSSLFRHSSEVHHHRTRRAISEGVFVEPVSTEQARRSFSHQAAMLWNSLPVEIRTTDSASKCRNMVYRLLLTGDITVPVAS